MRHPTVFWQGSLVVTGVIVLTIGLGALAARPATYLLFHSLVELASIVVGIGCSSEA
jgi:hypothetical protein